MKIRERLVVKIRAARRQLRQEGLHDSMDRVIERLGGGSKTTLTRYWALTEPDVPPVPIVSPARPAPAATKAPRRPRRPPTAGPVRVITAAAAAPMTRAAPAMPAVEHAFKQTFATYLGAAIKFTASQGIAGNEKVYPYLVTASRRVPQIASEFHLPRRHPLVMQLEEELAEAYAAHLDAWHAWQDSQSPPVVEITPAAPEPEPDPVTLESLRQHYWRETVLWPGVLPLTAYGFLRQLWQAADDEVVATQRKWRDARNASGQAETPAVRQAETTWSTARLRLHTLETEINGLRERARYEGTPL